MSSSDIPNTGSLRGDLLEVLGTMRSRMVEQYQGLLVGLMRAMQDDAEVAALIRAQLAANKQDVRRILERNSAERGERIGDVGVIEEIAPAQILMRILITGEPVDDDFFAGLVDRILLPLLDRGREVSTVD